MSPTAKPESLKHSKRGSIAKPHRDAVASLTLFYRHILPLAIVVVFFVALRVVRSPIADIDSYYHIKVSELIGKHGILTEFPWLEFTILAKPYVDMHFLYHLINVPLTWMFELEQAARVAGAAWGMLAIFMMHLLLTRLRIPYVGLWTLGIMAASYLFLYRMNMSKHPSASLAIQMWALIAFFEKRYRMLAVIGFIYVWLYQLFFILFPFAVIFTLVEYFDTGKVNKKYLLYVTGGVVAGLIINPYFPADFKFFYEHVFLAAGNPAKLPQGTEWSPFNSQIFVRACYGSVAALAATMFFALVSGTKLSGQAQVAMLLTGMFLVGYIRSRRFVEYFAPYSMIASALIWRDTVLHGGYTSWRPKMRGLAVAGILIAIAVGIGWNWKEVLSQLRDHIYPTRYRAAAAYLAQNSNEGDVVCHSDWDDFPELFFHNTKNHYIVGLDPNLLFLKNETKYRVWKAISDGRQSRPSQAMAQHFRAKFALADYNQKGFIAAAARDPGLSMCYQDSGSLVWKVDPNAGLRDRFEAENLVPLAALQPATTQFQVQNFTQMFGVPASGNRTVFVQTRNVGDYAEFAVPATQAGTYDCKAGYVKAADMGIIQWSCNGVQCSEPLDAYSNNPRSAGLAEFGRLSLRQGENRFRVTITGKNEKAIARRLAVDYIQVRQLARDQPTTPTVPG